MRENRKSGSEGGEPQFTAAFLPLSSGKHGKQDTYPYLLASRMLTPLLASRMLTPLFRIVKVPSEFPVIGKIDSH